MNGHLSTSVNFTFKGMLFPINSMKCYLVHSRREREVLEWNVFLSALKIYKVQFEGGRFNIKPRHMSSSQITSKAFVYKLQEIDILVNAWSLTKNFDALDILTRNAIEFGAKEV